MTKVNQFHQKEKPLTEEDKIRRRALIFGVLTLILSVALVIWGIPLFINLVDFLGEVKSEADQVTITDIIPPSVPRLSYIPEATNSAEFEIKGVTEPEAIVKVKVNNDVIESEVDEEGLFEIDKVILEKGTNKIIAWAVDADGNESEKTDQFEITYDTVSPDLEITKPDDGSEVDEQELEVSGRTEPSARILVNERVIIVNQDGEFVEQVILQEGENEINVVAEDSAGNTEEVTLTVTYTP